MSQIEMIRVQRVGSVLSLVLNRPQQKNALSINLLSSMVKVLEAEVNDSVTAVTLSGASSYFSAGADLGDLQGTVEDIAVDDAIAAAGQAIRKAPVPVIAAIEGYCFGAAVDLCLACDLRIGSSDAYMQVPATRLGLLYNPAAVQRMTQKLPYDVLFRMLCLGQKFSAEESLRVGLLSQIVEPGTALSTAVGIAEASAANDRSAVAATKELLNTLLGSEFDADFWHRIRVEKLDSNARRVALREAKEKVAAGDSRTNKD